VTHRYALIKPYLFSILSVVVACLVQWLFWPALQGAFFMVYLCAVLLTALNWGTGPGFFALAISLVKIAYFHLNPLWVQLGLKNYGAVRMSVYFVLSCGVIALCESWRKARALEQLASNEVEFLDRRLRDTLSIVSHDLRNPLSAVLLAAELIKRNNQKNPEKTIEKVSQIQLAGNRMNTLIEEIILKGRSEIGALRLDCTPEKDRDLIEDAVRIQRPFAETNQIAIKITSGTPSSEAECDRATIILALSNILNNAIRHSPPDGRVEIKYENDGRELKVSVQDYGGGISEQDLPLIFDRFWQAKKPSPARGLSVARGIIESHGGKMEIESKLGSGTRISFSLPTFQTKKQPFFRPRDTQRTG
jgi:signal transduction histidine kinase